MTIFMMMDLFSDRDRYGWALAGIHRTKMPERVLADDDLSVRFGIMKISISIAPSPPIMDLLDHPRSRHRKTQARRPRIPQATSPRREVRGRRKV